MKPPTVDNFIYIEYLTVHNSMTKSFSQWITLLHRVSHSAELYVIEHLTVYNSIT